MAHHQTSQYCRPLGLRPAGEILAVSKELGPWFFHLEAKAVVLFVWLRASLVTEWGVWMRWSRLPSAQVARDAGSGGR